MNYELAEQLKEKGFPYKKDWHTGLDDSILWYTPTLTELIEACGDKFYSIWKRNNGEWRVASEEIGNDFIVGSTPEEAVAKLWLELKRIDKLG